MRRPKARLRRLTRLGVRRISRSIEKSLPGLSDWLPTWGISLGLHLGLIVILAFLYFVQPAPVARDAIDADFGLTTPIGDDLTSLTKADRAGDPFTTSDSKEFPSIGAGPADPTVTTIAQAKAPVGIRYDAKINLASNVLTPNAKLTDIIDGRSAGVHVEDISAPFSGRDGDVKAMLIRRQGGTVESEKAVAAGLDWLARHQRPDGSWSLDTHSQCLGDGCPPDSAMVSDVAATGLAILPMMGAGHIHTKQSKYSESVRRGLGWLMKQQQRDGEMFLGGGFNSKMYTHAIATMALCEAYGLSKDPKLRTAAQRGLNYIGKVQSLSDGGWRYYEGQPGDTSVFGWQIFALRSGRLAGLVTPKNVVKGCHRYLNLAQTDDRGVTYSYLPGGGINPVMTAEGLLCRQYLGWPRTHPAMKMGTMLVAADLRESRERNIYYWYYATQLLHNMQDKDWKEWNLKVREGLVVMQRTGTGCDRGSWDGNQPQPDVQGRRAGRLYTTALSILTLEVYYRFLPLYRLPNEEVSLGEPSAAPAAKQDAAP